MIINSVLAAIYFCVPERYASDPFTGYYFGRGSLIVEVNFPLPAFRT
jgi:hypothetical protein